MATELKRSISISVSYAQEDEALKQELEDYLIIMQQSGLISGWSGRRVQRGTDWSRVIDSRLLTANIVLLLVSPALLASGYCAGAECGETLKRRDAGESIVVPIILHSVNLTGSPLGRIQCLPRAAIPVASWPNRHEAWQSVDQGIRRVIKSLLQDWG